jgi:hypothetical protein
LTRGEWLCQIAAPVSEEANLIVPVFFQTIEHSSFSSWLRESDSVFGFWFVLSWHAVGMVLLAGASALIDLRILGFAPDLPLAPLARLYRFIWAGFWIQVVSGTFLLIAYPTKALTNLDFYFKLTLIGIALTIMQRLKNRVLSDPSLTEAAMMAKGKALAIWSLILWLGAITAGRFLAYTYTYLTYPV